MAGHTITSDGLEALTRSQRRIDDSFGLASWTVVVGVLLAWAFVKLTLPDAGSPVEGSVLSRPLQLDQSHAPGLVERGDAAFATGYIVDPDGESALDLYRQALAEDADDEAAQRGFERVLEYLISEAEAAVFVSDWERARDHAAKVLALDPGNRDALEINERAARLQRVQGLLERAVSLYARGRLTIPAGENAAATYQQVLELDPDNAAAKQGLDSIVQRTIANAESALFAGKPKRAQAYLNRARAIDPDAPGLDSVMKTNRAWKNMQQSLESKADLRAASEALQAGRFVAPDQPNAFDLYTRVLERDPRSEAARRGLDLVRTTLIERARTLLAAEDVGGARALLDAAARARVDEDVLAPLRDEAAYQQRLLEARAGRFDRLHTMSDLTAVKQDAPVYPRAAPSGARASANLQFTVAENGSVTDVAVVNEIAPYFERAAVAAVKGWKFHPVMERGRPIPVRVAVTVAFEG